MVRKTPRAVKKLPAVKRVAAPWKKARGCPSSCAVRLGASFPLGSARGWRYSLKRNLLAEGYDDMEAQELVELADRS